MTSWNLHGVFFYGSKSNLHPILATGLLNINLQQSEILSEGALQAVEGAVRQAVVFQPSLWWEASASAEATLEELHTGMDIFSGHESP